MVNEKRNKTHTANIQKVIDVTFKNDKMNNRCAKNQVSSLNPLSIMAVHRKQPQ